MRRNRASALILVAALVMLLVPGVSAAAGTVSIQSLARDGDALAVTGGSTYTAQPFVSLGTDPSGDTLVPGLGEAGADLVDVQLATQLDGRVRFRWVLDKLPGGTDGLPAGMIYWWAFCVDGANCSVITTQRIIWLPTHLDGGYDLWRCSDSSCQGMATWGGGWNYNSTGPATYDSATGTITATVAGSSISATPGSRISMLVAAETEYPVFSLCCDSATWHVREEAFDGIQEVADFTVAERQVSLAVAPSGLDPASVSYTTHVAPVGGGYTASLDVAGLSGPHTVYARACFGSNNCGYATRDVNL